MKPKIAARIREARQRASQRRRLHGVRKHRWMLADLRALAELSDAEAAQRLGVSRMAIYHARRKYLRPAQPPESILPEIQTIVCALSSYSSYSLSLRR